MNKSMRTEKHNINRGSPLWKVCDELCFQSKNLYNYANYIIRQKFINKEGIIKYNDLWKMMKTEQVFKDIGSNSGQHTLKLLCRDWKSFMELLKKYNKNPNSILGRPKLPHYKKKNGRHICILTNMQTQIKDGYLYFAFKKMKDFNNTIIVFDLSRYKLYPYYVEQALRPFFEIYKARCYKRVIMNLFKPQKVLGYKMEQLAKKLFLRDMLEIVYM